MVTALPPRLVRLSSKGWPAVLRLVRALGHARASRIKRVNPAARAKEHHCGRDGAWGRAAARSGWIRRLRRVSPFQAKKPVRHAAEAKGKRTRRRARRGVGWRAGRGERLSLPPRVAPGCGRAEASPGSKATSDAGPSHLGARRKLSC